MAATEGLGNIQCFDLYALCSSMLEATGKPHQVSVSWIRLLSRLDYLFFCVLAVITNLFVYSLTTSLVDIFFNSWHICLLWCPSVIPGAWAHEKTNSCTSSQPPSTSPIHSIPQHVPAFPKTTFTREIPSFVAGARKFDAGTIGSCGDSNSCSRKQSTSESGSKYFFHG